MAHGLQGLRGPNAARCPSTMARRRHCAPGSALPPAGGQKRRHLGGVCRRSQGVRRILEGLEGPSPPVEPFAAARKRLEQVQRKRIALCRDIVRAAKRRDEFTKALADEEAKLAKLQAHLGESDAELAEAQAEVESMAAQAAAPPTADASTTPVGPADPDGAPDDEMPDVDFDTAACEQELLAKRDAADAELAQLAAKRSRRRAPSPPSEAGPSQASHADLAMQLREVQQQAKDALAAAPVGKSANADGTKNATDPTANAAAGSQVQAREDPAQTAAGIARAARSTP